MFSSTTTFASGSGMVRAPAMDFDVGDPDGPKISHRASSTPISSFCSGAIPSGWTSHEEIVEVSDVVEALEEKERTRFAEASPASWISDSLAESSLTGRFELRARMYLEVTARMFDLRDVQVQHRGKGMLFAEAPRLRGRFEMAI